MKHYCIENAIVKSVKRAKGTLYIVTYTCSVCGKKFIMPTDWRGAERARKHMSGNKE